MQIVAVDWDVGSARVAVAARRPTGAVLLRVAELACDTSPAALASKLREALPEVRWSKIQLVVALGGRQVGFRMLTLPPAPAAELPAMVQLMADREFGGGDGVVDFLPLLGADKNATQQPEAGAQRVLAARAPREAMAAAEELASGLGVACSRVVLRAAAAASFGVRLDAGLAHGDALVACPAGSAVDMAVTRDGSPVIIRSGSRSGFEASDQAAATREPAELRRTLTAAAMQLGRPVAATFSLVEPEGEAAARLAEAALQWRLPASDHAALPLAAAAAGAALDEAERARPVIDLLNPRRPTVDQTPRRRQALYGALAATLLLAVVWYCYDALAGYGRQIAEVKAKTAQQQSVTDRLADDVTISTAVDQWLATDVNWLDELETLSRQVRPVPLSEEDFPASDDLMLTGFSAAANQSRRGTGGQISLDALARTADGSTLLEQRVSGAGRSVRQGSLDQTGPGRYRWRLKPTIRVAPAEADPGGDAR
ncbi:MAG: hypothetical protein AAF790_09690 [Planctomycetota bacterium]